MRSDQMRMRYAFSQAICLSLCSACSLIWIDVVVPFGGGEQQ